MLYTSSTHEALGDVNPYAAGQEYTTVASPWRPRRALPALAGLFLFVGALLVVARTHVPHRGYTHGQVSEVENLDSEDVCQDFQYVHLDKIVHNNLGNTGPDAGAEGIVYEGTHKKPNELDTGIVMVVNATSPLKSTLGATGMQGEYAMIGALGNTNVSVTFMFYDNLMNPKTIPGMDFSFHDLDTHQSGNEAEYVRVWNYKDYVTTVKNTLLTTNEDDGSVTFTATEPGVAQDNPKDSFLLTSAQKNKAVTVEFRDVSQFQLEFGSKDKVDFGTRNYRAFHIVPQPTLLCAETEGIDTTGGITITRVVVPSTTTTTTTTFTTTAYRRIISTTTSGGARKSRTSHAGWCSFIIPIIHWCFHKFW